MVKRLLLLGLVVAVAGFSLYYLFDALGIFKTTPNRPHVILITADTLRADHVGCYGYSRPVTPHLDRLADQSTVFLNCTSPANSTNPSFASMLTGTYVKTHGVIALSTFGYRLNPELKTLAETLQEDGYRTMAAVSAHHLAGELSGFGQGFDDFFDVIDPECYKQPAPITNENVLPYLEEEYAGGKGEKPLFLWLHYFDPHDPYVTRPEYLNRVLSGKEAPDPDSIPGRIALYDSEIAFMDEAVGDVLTFLRENDMFDDSLIVFGSDHGENFGEHDPSLVSNHFRLFEPVVHVPLIIKRPGQTEGFKIESAVQSVDIYPTVVTLLSSFSRVPSQVEGMELTDVLFGSESEIHPFVFSEGGSNKERMIKGRQFKLTHDVRRDRVELYHLGKDPTEMEDLEGKEPEAVRELKSKLDAFVGPQRVRFVLSGLPEGREECWYRGWLRATTRLSVADRSSLEGGDVARAKGSQDRVLEIAVKLGDRDKEFEFDFLGGPLFLEGGLEDQPLEASQVQVSGVPLTRTDVGPLYFDLTRFGETGESAIPEGMEASVSVERFAGQGPRKMEVVIRARSPESGPTVIEGRILSDRDLIPIPDEGNVKFFRVGPNRLRFRTQRDGDLSLRIGLEEGATMMVLQVNRRKDGAEALRIPRTRISANFVDPKERPPFFLMPNFFTALLDTQPATVEDTEGSWNGIQLIVRRSEFSAILEKVNPDGMDEATRRRMELLGYVEDPKEVKTPPPEHPGKNEADDSDD